MSDRGTCWSVTINNPTKSDEEWIAQARLNRGWKVYGQLEKGESGTPHYQLCVTTPQVRFSAMKKAFPRANIQVARDKMALMKYVQKEDTRVGELPSSPEFVTPNKLMSWYGEYYDQVVSLHGEDRLPLLDIFDTMIKQKIMEGFYVESYGANPQIRAQIKQYGKAIAFRERLLRRQKDRQTTESILPVEDITQDASPSRSRSSSQVSSDLSTEETC